MTLTQPNKYTVLLVEDEKDIRDVYSAYLKSEGFGVVEAEDGEVAVTKAQTEPWDLMLLDLMLPKVDGLKVLKTVKETLKTASKPVLLLTNLGDEAIISRTFEYGADGYLIKAEITPDKIVAELRKFLE